MYSLRNTFFLSVILASVLALTGCPSQTTISKVASDPAKYRNKQVILVGTVTDSYGLLGKGIYELDDGTGRIWVITESGVPNRGARVGTSGQVRTGASYNGRNYGLVMQEAERRVKRN